MKKNVFLFITLTLIFIYTSSYAMAIGGGGCFLEGTPILLADGSYKPIDKLEAGDFVSGLNTETNKQTTNRILEVKSPRQVDGYYNLITESTQVKVTGEHPFYVGNGEYKKVEELRIGDEIIILEDNEIVSEKIIDKTYFPKKVTVYNIQTDGFNNYIASDIVVHNKGGGGGGGGAGGGAGGGDGGGGGYYAPPVQHECSSGQIQTQSCGLGGTQTRRCEYGFVSGKGSIWHWGSWGSCQGQGVCNSGATQSQSCGSNVGQCVSGTQTRTCSNWYWGGWSGCGGGYVGPSTEVCDGLDNDCNGQTDEGGVCGPRLNVPDQSIQEDSGLNDNLVDLQAYTTDPDTPLAAMTYTFVSQTRADIVNCVLDSNRYIDCTTQSNQFGSNDVTIQVTDGTYTSSDTFTVNVLNVNDPPEVNITYPAPSYNYFVENFYVNVIAGTGDVDGDALTYSVDWDNGVVSTNNVVNNVVNIRYAYPSVGNYRINVTVSDGTLTDSDAVDIVVWPYGFNITNLNSYDDSDFTNQDTIFYRNEPLYIKFNVIQKDAGFLVPNNMNRVYMYNRDNPSNIYDLTAYNGVANGITIVNGQPSIPDGSYYYYMPNIPISDDVLGWNIVFVFSYDGTNAGQAELEIQILNNPIQLSNIPVVTLDQLSGSTAYHDLNLGDYVSDVETPDNEIMWSFTGMINTIVNILANNIARFSASVNWEGAETLVATADDNDGSTANTNVVVSSGNPVVTVVYPDCGDVVYGTIDIQWTAIDYQGDTLTIDLEYSDDSGATWNTIASGLSNTGTYSWNTLGLPQGNQYIVRVTATDTGGLIGQDTSDCPFIILSSPDVGLSANIIADKTAGEVPLEVEFDVEVTNGNTPFSYAWDFNNDGIIDSTKKSPKTIFTEVGRYSVMVTVTDFDGDTATDTVIIRANEQRVKLPRKKIHINTINIVNDELKAGEDLVVYVTFENQGNYKIKDSTATVIVPDLALRQKKGHIDLKTDEGVTRKFVFEIPKNAEPGEYEVMIMIYDNGLKRIRYRPIEIIA